MVCDIPTLINFYHFFFVEIFQHPQVISFSLLSSKFIPQHTQAIQSITFDCLLVIIQKEILRKTHVNDMWHLYDIKRYKTFQSRHKFFSYKYFLLLFMKILTSSDVIWKCKTLSEKIRRERKNFITLKFSRYNLMNIRRIHKSNRCKSLKTF